MEVFDVFKSLDFILIGKCMAVELFLGVFAGIIVSLRLSSMQVAQMMSKYFERQTIPQDILVETFQEELLIPSNFPQSLSLSNSIAMKSFLKISLPF